MLLPLFPDAEMAPRAGQVSQLLVDGGDKNLVRSVAGIVFDRVESSDVVGQH